MLVDKLCAKINSKVALLTSIIQVDILQQIPAKWTLVDVSCHFTCIMQD